MKKVIEKIVRKVFLSACAVFLLSCDAGGIGLGEAIDLEAPEVKITSNNDNDAVPGEFYLSGTAYDNDAVSSISVSFESQNLYYKIIPGENWFKKNTASNNEWVEVTNSEGSCVLSNGTWNWSIYVRTSEGDASGTTYVLSAVVTDKIGNSGAKSKVELSLIMDQNNPDVTIYMPELMCGSYDDVYAEASAFELKDGSVLSKLFNGDITLTGRQSGSISFKELRIDFDSGKLTSGTRMVTGDAEAQLSVDLIAENTAFEEEEPVVYYSKTLRVGENGVNDLRNWKAVINQSDWVNSVKNSNLISLGTDAGSGKLIRVVTTSLSDSLAWEKKVIGWFVWWPEADEPWITTYSGDSEFNEENTYAVYPASNFSGIVQDDDGLQSIVYSIYKLGESSWQIYKDNTELALSDEGAKYSAFSIQSPKENGYYKIDFIATDIYGTSISETKYFRTLDVTPPKIELESPENSSSVLLDEDGNITFSGKVTDDGTINSLKLIYLNPLANNDPDNIIRYMSGSESEWNLASVNGSNSRIYSFTDDGVTVSYSNRIYEINLSSPVYNDETKNNEYSFNRVFNIFDDFEINAETKPLVTQYFVLRAIDNGGTTTVSQISLKGDLEAPELTVDSIEMFNSLGNSKFDEYTFAENDVPTLPVVKSGDYVIIKGTWYDNSVLAWGGDAEARNKIGSIDFSWGSASFEILSEEVNASSGVWSWTAKVTDLPYTTKPFTASLKDLAGNKKSVGKSIFIDTSDIGIVNIGSNNEDGYYKGGSKIEITLDFTKNTSVSGSPTLTLNNGATALYKSGSGSSQHVFEYTVGVNDTDTENITGNTAGTLNVVKLNKNGATYTDVNTNAVLSDEDLKFPTDSSKLLGSGRNIRIDNTAPKVSELKVVSSAGNYCAGKTILFLLSFDESVSLEGAENLGLSFVSIASPVISAESSGSNVIFAYTVSAGENSNLLTLNSITGTNAVTVKDEAGNLLTDWSISSTLNNEICIDTSAPSAPSIVKAWGDSKLVTQETSFTLSNIESDAKSAEYSLDGGSNWQIYSSAVNLKNNGTYIIKARQTDKAGNVSPAAIGGSITVEKGDFLNKITSDTVSGSYSVNKGGKVNGRIIFRKNITLPASSYVTLNVKNSSGTAYTCLLSKAASASISGGCDYLFTYEISEGDYIEDNAALEVIGWSFNSVTYSTGVEGIGDITYAFSYSSFVTDEKKLSANRSIYILTGVPEVESAVITGSVTSDGIVSDLKLLVTYDRAISKVTGNIVLSLDGDSDSDSFIAPAVMSAADYSDLFESYYTEGLNGAFINSDSTLTNDTTTKYVLNYAIEPTDEDLVSLFVEDGWNILSVPVVASSITVTDKVLTVDLSDTYKLPVKGAKYKLAIPAGAVSDEVQNKSFAYTSSIQAPGVESPVIRINKKKQTVTPGTSPDYTVNSSVSMPDTANVRIDCQTPRAVIKYGKTSDTDAVSTAVSVINSNTAYQTKTADVTVPSAASTYSEAFDLGSTISSYSTAKGLKYAISAYASKDDYISEKAYEYATRTVLKLKISGGYSTDSDGKYSTTTAITENDSTLTFGQLKVWVVGGDYTSGGNSIEPFPLAWSGSSNFKLMKGSFQSSMNCEWYWVCWDITTATYHGFIIGDVPSDAAGNGPSQWYSAEGGWDAQKMNYPLYPGETLIMTVSSTGSYPNGKYHWRSKNHGTR